MKKKNILLIVFPIIAIILELLPNGVTMNWGQRMPDGTLGTIQKHCSFFNPTPAAYGDFAPFFTAILSTVLLIVCLVFVFSGKGKLAVRILSVATFVMSVIALVMAIFLLSYYSAIGIAITVALGVQTVLSFYLLSTKAKTTGIEPTE